MAWAIVVVGLLVAGSSLPVEAASGRGGGGSGSHVGSPGVGTRSHAGNPRWGGGYYHGESRGWYGGTRVFIGGGFGWWGWPGWWGPGYWGASYPYYTTPSVAIQPAPSAQDYYWYYCANAGAYYPYVKDCPGGWMQVVPAPNPPGP